MCLDEPAGVDTIDYKIFIAQDEFSNLFLNVFLFEM